MLYGGEKVPQRNQRKRMYSPKIDESLIPRVYRAAKAANIPMTTWVNRAVEGALSQATVAQQPQSLTILHSAGELEAPAPRQARIPA